MPSAGGAGLRGHGGDPRGGQHGGVLGSLGGRELGAGLGRVKVATQQGEPVDPAASALGGEIDHHGSVLVPAGLGQAQGWRRVGIQPTSASVLGGGPYLGAREQPANNHGQHVGRVGRGSGGRVAKSIFRQRAGIRHGCTATAGLCQNGKAPRC